MPGGQKEAYELVAPILKQIAAVAEDGEPCVTYIGADGAGHYVKMVHNGIEYGDMQLIAEAYALLKGGLALSNEELAQTFTEWNEGELSSYLIDITKDIFTKKDEEGKYLVDANLLLAPYFKQIADDYQQALRDVVAYAVQNGIPVPTFSAAIAYYDSYRSAVLPANLIQAQRDYFGAHTYKRTDKEGVFHTEWLE